MQNDINTSLSDNEILELIQATGFKPYSEDTFFSKFAMLIKENMFDRHPKLFKTFYITFFTAIILNIIVAMTYLVYPVDIIKYFDYVSFLLVLISSLALTLLFGHSVLPILFEGFKYLTTNRYVFWGALYDIVSFLMVVVAMSVGFVAYIDVFMHITFGFVKSMELTNEFNNPRLFINILVSVAMFMILGILQKMLIASNFKIRLGLYIVLYFCNLFIVKSYVSGEFLNYVDLNQPNTLVLGSDYYYKVFCHILVFISANYFLISFYSKIYSSYHFIHLNNLVLRLSHKKS